ncbi:uncharacterized protein LOC143518471 isoform X2 [Brachyhypopomus gauderio]|uniref:uncharacterized protein LOC143518471 isoform X2 n=1 Tax=Brachyhypopomus gauderio TaxID=698409 RepID=UPI0040424AB2
MPLHLKSVLIDAIPRNPITAKATDLDVERCMKWLLQLAGDREGGRRARMRTCNTQSMNPPSLSNQWILLAQRKGTPAPAGTLPIPVDRTRSPVPPCDASIRVFHLGHPLQRTMVCLQHKVIAHQFCKWCRTCCKVRNEPSIPSYKSQEGPDPPLSCRCWACFYGVDFIDLWPDDSTSKYITEDLQHTKHEPPFPLEPVDPPGPEKRDPCSSRHSSNTCRPHQISDSVKEPVREHEE